MVCWAEGNKKERPDEERERIGVREKEREKPLLPKLDRRWISFRTYWDFWRKNLENRKRRRNRKIMIIEFCDVRRYSYCTVQANVFAKKWGVSNIALFSRIEYDKLYSIVMKQSIRSRRSHWDSYKKINNFEHLLYSTNAIPASSIRTPCRRHAGRCYGGTKSRKHETFFSQLKGQVTVNDIQPILLFFPLSSMCTKSLLSHLSPTDSGNIAREWNSLFLSLLALQCQNLSKYSSFGTY